MNYFCRGKPFAVDATQAAILGSTIVSLGAFQFVNNLMQQPEIAKSLRENPITDFLEDIIAQGQQVVQQRSSSSEEVQYQHQHQYQQPVYQPQQYQQYVPELVPPPQ